MYGVCVAWVAMAAGEYGTRRSDRVFPKPNTALRQGSGVGRPNTEVEGRCKLNLLHYLLAPHQLLP